jgi:hypothetical protein
MSNVVKTGYINNKTGEKDESINFKFNDDTSYFFDGGGG